MVRSHGSDACSHVQDTLKKSHDTFGPCNFDLYEAFQGLMSRYLPPTK